MRINGFILYELSSPALRLPPWVRRRTEGESSRISFIFYSIRTFASSPTVLDAQQQSVGQTVCGA